MDGLCALGTQTVFLFVAARRTELMRLSGSLLKITWLQPGFPLVVPVHAGT